MTPIIKIINVLENQFCNLLMIAFIQQSLLLSVNSSAESSTESSEATPQ